MVGEGREEMEEGGNGQGGKTRKHTEEEGESGGRDYNRDY